MRQGYIDPNFPNPDGSGDASIIVYGYTPSASVAILGLSLFSANLLVLSIRLLHFRLWSYTPIIVGCILEVIGYSFRYLSSRVDPYRITFFIVQYFCITVAPVFISASVYVYLSKFATWAAAQGYCTGFIENIGHNTILWIFITADTVCTLLQVTGAALIGVKTSKHDDPTEANYILVGGLAAQTAAFLIFLVLLTSLVMLTNRSQEQASTKTILIMKKCSFTLCFAGGLIFLRTIFRFCESAQGVFGYLSSREVFFGILEFAPVIVAVALLTYWTPTHLNLPHTTEFWKRSRGTSANEYEDDQ